MATLIQYDALIAMPAPPAPGQPPQPTAQQLQTAKNEYNLIVLAGEKTSSGHSLDFKNATLSNQNLNLYFEEISPGDQSKVLTVMTYPYCLLKINKIENYQINVIFE